VISPRKVSVDIPLNETKVFLKDTKVLFSNTLIEHTKKVSCFSNLDMD